MQINLLLDERSVAHAEGVCFGLNQARKHPDNPVLLPGEPHQWDSLQVSWPATVLYSPGDEKFRCWYSGLDAIQSPARRWLPGYAESPDGVHWRKPELGEVEFLGRPTNQLNTYPEAYILSLVFENPLPGRHESRRFGCYWTENTRGSDGQADRSLWRKALAWSPDGIRWTRCCTAYQTPPFDRPSLQDICQLLYDLDEPDPAARVKGYTQIFRPRRWDGRPNVRHIGLVLGRSFEELSDAPDPIVLAPEQGIDEELHFASISKVGAAHLMLFESDRFSRNPIHGDLRLAVSSDGREFRRLHPNQPLVPTGPKGSWDENLLVTTTQAMQEVGDEVYIFYIGCPNIYNSWPANYAVDPQRRGSMFAPTYLGLATLPRDRFAYAAGPGVVMTHPLNVKTGGFWLNFDGPAPDVLLRDTSEKTVARGFCNVHRWRSVYRGVTWEARVPKSAVKLEVRLPPDSRLYSLAWE